MPPWRRSSTAISVSTLQREGNTLAIKTFGHEHRWGSVMEGVKTKAMHHLSFGCYAEDIGGSSGASKEQGSS